MSSSPPMTVKKTVTSTGARISTRIKQESQESDMEAADALKPTVGLKKSASDVVNEYREHLQAEKAKEMANEDVEESGSDIGSNPGLKVKEESNLGVEEKVQAQENPYTGLSYDEYRDYKRKQKMADNEVVETGSGLGSIPVLKAKEESEEIKPDLGPERKVNEEDGKMAVKGDPCVGFMGSEDSPDREFAEYIRAKGWRSTANEKDHTSQTKEERPEEANDAESGFLSGCMVKKEPEIESNTQIKEVLCLAKPVSSRPAASVTAFSSMMRGHTAKKERVEDRSLSTVLIEDGDFPEEPDWLLVGRTAITGLSTAKGRKLENNEIVHIAFPTGDARFKQSGIVRFSTKRSGEIGRLPMEWAKCLTPLVNSSKVKMLCRCVAAPLNLHLMQEILLYASFYIHRSVFTEGDKSSWRLDASPNIDSTIYPLLTLFNLLKIKPFQKAEFTPEELNSRKRVLNLEGDVAEAVSVLPMVKRQKGSQQYLEPNKDEQAISESSLNKLVGAAEVYNLEEMEPPCTLMCDLRPYQKQALYWMSESEKGIDVEKASETLHPCWAAYHICDERASAIYVNNFSGEATTQFPAATQMARGGILADAMGLGKTVMTIALILARRGRGSPEDEDSKSEDEVDTQYLKKERRNSETKVRSKVRGGTLIVCPMALLSQWNDELETHSKPGSVSVCVHYGGVRSNDPKVIAEPDIVLTTYGVLTAAYKTDGEYSIFHKVDWYRVVLDEAHTIKSSRTQGAQAAFKLSSHCRWCLTGTPLQNNLEDLYSLLCFLHVEPWCNWAWWSKLIQKPYENGDHRGLKLIKAILRPLMLRRTKDSKDKLGRPILILPPADIQVIECEQSEGEHDFYDALFRRSKVQFDQFVAQGKVLHNYANILELLLRLRQCCNHPFLVMSRGDSQQFADLNKLARRFLETNPDSATSNQRAPTRAYVEEVVEGIRKGENTECPICLESADDPVLTPCAHRMCRECLLSSWRSPAVGLCPICRQLLKKNELITCPSENRFRVDINKNWKESSKVLKLLECLERVIQSGEKSIVFSQWTSFMDLLEIPLKRRGIGFLRFDGKLSQKHRERVLKEFSETRENMVLLMSLKAGGVGLNLTAASNVFLMDPWWNPAVEEQAIMRIHRIGQKRTVRVRRFIVKDTVEERMQQVQARKQRMIAGALTDEEVRSARLEELKMLFR